jgi:cell division protein FtsW
MSSWSARITAELRGDRVIWAILALLALFSILAVYSATGTLAYRERGGNTEAFIFKHMVIMGGGVLLTYLFHLMHYKRYSNWAPMMLALSIPLLLYTILMGADINDARRWIMIPFVGITIQTSDFAKLALIIYVARSISSRQDYIKDFKNAFLPIIVPVLIICGLIAPADLSTAALLFIVCVLMMVLGRVDMRYIILLLLLGIVVFAMLIFIGHYIPDFVRVATWENRIREFVQEPDQIYQVVQAKIAIANGEWFGVGPGNSIQRNYLPSPYSDFIYAIICEEYGIIGGALLIGLYLLLFFRVTRLVTKSSKAFGAMVALGLSLLLIIQAYLNIAVSVNLVPVTGLTLPLISMGGTSIVFTCVAFGIILSVSKFMEAVGE